MVKLYNKYYIKNYEKMKDNAKKKYWINLLKYNPDPKKLPDVKFTKGKYTITFT